ncbi:hypothetical protein EV681_4579 [Advenella incenata]|uniref:Uncharacterized protein n=1 Tax=Advenella incenata TaxID=267800 RepID=A0A4Q7V3P7_9BURK|nr:hypothetical protein [Advenella incenata]RZT91056.1 hypothetical protein EV681_4579 [Advenella incenata]
MNKKLESTMRRAVISERAQRGMSWLLFIEILWLAGTLGLVAYKFLNIGNWAWLVGGLAYFGFLWLRRYSLFCKVMSIIFTVYWVFGFTALSYSSYGISAMTIGVAVVSLIFIGGIHWRGLQEMDDLYAR